MKKILLLVSFFISKIISGQACWAELGNQKVTLANGNTISFANDGIFTTCSGKKGNIYAAGSFHDENGHRFVAKWNGSIWTELGTSTNRLAASDTIRTICTDDSVCSYLKSNQMRYRFMPIFV